MSNNGELAVVGSSITQPARNRFAAEQWALIKDTVAKECNDAELALFLETCARHDLDPLIRQIWTIKIKGRMVPVVARDGFLAIANRHTGQGWTGESGEYLGTQSDTVRLHDYFEKVHKERPDGTIGIFVDHRYRDKDDKPTHGGEDGSLRGPIVGAWAIVKRRGHNDAYYYGFWKTYNKAENAWETHPDAMIVKCAESTALRKGFSVSGVIGEGEAARSTLTEAEAQPSEIVWPEDEQLTDRLKTRFRQLGYRRAKVRMLVNAVADQEGYHNLLSRLDEEWAQLQAGEEPPAEDVPDAEVVQ